MDAAEEYPTSVALGVRGRSIKHLSYLILSIECAPICTARHVRARFWGW